MREGIVYWITGLSGAGKTTVGKGFYDLVKKERENIVFLDGDVLRGIFENYEYSHNDRIRYARKIFNLCKELSSQGIDIVICAIAMSDEIRGWYKENIKNYIQIFLDVPLEELKKRDPKGLYKKAMDGRESVVGVNQEAELPKDADIVIANYGDTTPDMAIDYLYKELIEKNAGL